MEVTGANPFLMMEEEHKSPQSSFNPFLMEDTSTTTAPQVTTENPFFFASTEPATTTLANNPFAFDSMDYAPTKTSAESDLFGTGLDDPIFSSANTIDMTAAPPTNITTTSDLLGGSDFLTDTTPNQPAIQPTLTKPSDLDLKTNTDTTLLKNDLNNTNDKNKKPQRPPPPRTTLPPSKETKDLILSVTGAMDATSSHLLDRIPPTRTPSPVSMRDLHSPSPTPDLFANDLVDVDNNTELTTKKEIDFFDLNDELPSTTNATTTSTTVTSTAVSDSMMLMKDSDPFENTIKKSESIIETTKIAGDPFSSLINTSDTLTNAFCDINQNQTTIKQPTRPPPPQKPPPPKPAPPPQIKPITTSFNSHSTVTSVPPPKPPPPKPIPPRPLFSTFTPTTQTTSFQSTIASTIMTSTTLVVTSSVVSAPSLVTTVAAAPTLVSITSAASSETVVKTFTPASTVKASSTITQNSSTVEILSSTKSFTETTQPSDIFAEPNVDSSIGISSPSNKPLIEAEQQPTDIFAEPITTTAADTTLTSVKPMEETSVFDENISQDIRISPPKQVDVDNSAKNPFSFEEDTKLIDTLSYTQADTNTQLLDDFMGATNTASTTVNNNTILQTNNIFDAQPEQTETKTEGGFNDLFGSSEPVTDNILDVFESKPNVPSAPVDIPKQSILEKFRKQSEDFDAFAAKFESAKENATNDDSFDPFSGARTTKASDTNSAWGDTLISDEKVDVSSGFGAEEPFDSFLSLSEPPPAPQCTPARITKAESDSDEDKDFAVFIKPKNLNLTEGAPGEEGIVPTLAPPPKSPIQSSVSDTSPRFNPFDQQQEFAAISESGGTLPQESAHLERTDSQETPPTPLFDEDTSQPLEPFPRTTYVGEGWEMQLRQPNKKKITGQRFWKKIFLRLVYQGDNPVLQLFNAQTDKDPFQELPLQACYSVSEIGAQQYDQFGKIFTVKLQYVFYKERPGVRPGQVTKAERITNKLSQFAAYAIQGDYQGVKEFGSDLKKLGLPVEHAPQISQLFKIGSQNYEHMKEFSSVVEEALFRLTVHRDRALHYKMEEVQVTVVDELYVEQNYEGGVDKQIARVRLFFLGFLSGMPDIELGVNDMRRQGKEVVGRHDIIPVVTEEWIRLENVEFHACVQQEEYHKTHIIRFKPPDACYIELMRFRVRPPKNRELPLQLKATMCVTGNKVELRADVLVPGFASRKLGQVPCEDVMIRFPIPECWIYLFRVEKHFRYGSVKSAHRRTGKIKGIERFLGAVETLQESLIEVTSGQAKYEHQHRAIVWRCPRLPKEGQGAYTTHNLVCRMALTSFDQIPEQLAEYCYVEFTMPATQVSHTTVRSVSVQGSDSDEPPEKYVRYLARHEYRVGIEHTKGDSPPAYLAATIVRPPVPETNSTTPIAESSDSDSD